MSFDIFFMPCRFGTKTIVVADGESGKIRTVLPNEPLGVGELSRVRSVLAAATSTVSNDDTFYACRFPDGGSAEVFASDLEEGCMVAVRGMTSDIAAFLFELLKAGNWVMIPAMRDTGAIATTADAFKSVPEDFPLPIVCSSTTELGTLLKDGLKAWAAYRDDVVRTAVENQSR